MVDDMFLWYWKTSDYTEDYFWFDQDAEEGFGYRMSTSPEDFEIWNREDALDNLHRYIKVGLRVPVFGPFRSEIPPIILKIRIMEQRHKRFLERKQHAI